MRAGGRRDFGAVRAPLGSTLGWVLVVVCLAAAVPHEAQACTCGPVLLQAGRLNPGEQVALQFGLAGAFEVGHFDPGARFRFLSGGARSSDFRVSLSAEWRLSEQWQARLAGGWAEGFRRFGEDEAWGGAPTDLLASVRYEPAALRLLAFSASLLVPTGRTTLESRAPLGADVTGRGAAALRVNGIIERDFGPWFTQGDLGATVSGPERGSGINPAAGADLALFAGRALRSGVELAAGLRLEVFSPLWREGVRLPDSHRVRLGLLGSAGIEVSRGWSMVGSAGVNPPLSFTAVNTRAEWSLSLGARWAPQP